MQSRSTLDVVAKNQLNILVQLAQADKHFANEERDMIYRICRERNFPEDKLLDLIRNGESVASLGALSVGQKFVILFACVKLMVVDSRIMDSELLFCRGIAIKMGLKKDVIDYLVENLTVNPSELETRVFTDFVA